MPVDLLKLTKHCSVPIYFLQKGAAPSPLYWIQGRRSPLQLNNQQNETAYKGMLKFYVSKLAKIVDTDFDAVVSPPSSNEIADPYRKKLRGRKKLRAGEIDFSDCFCRQGKVKSSNSGTILRDVIKEFSYTANGEEADVKSILIVDDLVNSGRSIKAVMYHMIKNGLQRNCKIAIATPLWLPLVLKA